MPCGRMNRWGIKPIGRPQEDSNPLIVMKENSQGRTIKPPHTIASYFIAISFAGFGFISSLLGNEICKIPLS